MTVTDKKIALAGNPNVGKSTLFNALTGLKQHTGNWAGKTVDLKEGGHIFGNTRYTLVDLPGTYSLSSNSPEEEIARDYIKNAGVDCVIAVCDASCLERNLNLVLQITEVTPKVVLCLNLMDEAKKKKITIDIEKIEKSLGIPVIPVTARSKSGLNRLMAAVQSVIDGEITPNPVNLPDLDSNANARISAAEKICAECVRFGGDNTNISKIDRLLTGKLVGIPVMILFFTLIFWLTIKGANYPSELLSKGFALLKTPIASAFKNAPGWLSGILIDGVYTVLTWVISVMLPPMAIFFPLFTLLEDLGYLPRIAFNLDNFFKKAHACGKQSLTMAMGFGCNACGVIGARIIDSPRERLIAILTNVLVPCNGRFPAIILFITLFIAGGVFSPALLTAVIIFGAGMTLLISWVLSKTVLKGQPSSFTFELPPYRKPQIAKTLIRSLIDRTLFVLGRAVMVAAPAGAVIWLFANVHIGGGSLLNIFTDFLDPFGRVLGLDGVIIAAFILGFPANEIVVPLIIMAYSASGNITETANIANLRELLVNNGWTAATAISAIIMTVCRFPCSTTCLTVFKETKSVKWTAAAIIIPTVTGIVLCLIFNAARQLL